MSNIFIRTNDKPTCNQCNEIFLVQSLVIIQETKKFYTVCENCACMLKLEGNKIANQLDTKEFEQLNIAARIFLNTEVKRVASKHT